MKKKHEYAQLISYRGQKKLLSIMKLSFILTVLFTFQLSAGIYSQSKVINLTVKDATVKEIFKSIENQSNFRFFYNDELSDVNRMVSINVNNSKIEDVLTQLFDQSKVTFQILENNLIVIAPRQATQVQKVSGRVTDAISNEPLVGVNIIIEGSTIGTVTDVDGKFDIEVSSKNAVLLVTYIGYNSERIAINSQSSFEIKLVPDIKALDEVVVIGYGTMKKKDLTGAISQVTSDDINKRIVSRVDQALAGTMSGVQVRQPNGQPGSAMIIRIRGTASINSNTDPLYIIDGFPTQDLNNLNTNDVESIDVLKDASSTAIYGSRGSNGVVIITTKRGKAGKTSLQYDGYLGFQKLSKKVDLLNSEDYISLVTDARNNAYLDKFPTRSITDLNAARGNSAYYLDPNWSNPSSFPNTDWQDAVYRVAPVHSHQLSASGGNEMVKFFISGNYFSQDGIIKKTAYDRLSFRANVELKVNKKLNVGLNLSPSYANSKLSTPNYQGYNVVGKDGVIHKTLIQIPILSSDYNTFADGTYQYGTTSPNPIYMLNLSDDKKSTFRVLASVYGEYEIFKDFKYKVSYSTNMSNDKTAVFYPKGIDVSYANALGYDASATWRDWLIEHLLSYNKKFDKHFVSVMGGYSAQKSHIWTNSLQASGFPNDFVHTLNAGTSFSNQGSNESESRMISQFGRINYTFGDKYLLTASIRRDGSSRFSQGNYKWGLFPSASVAWRLSEEEWFKLPAISGFKLRASYGKTGNNNIGDYQYYPTINGANYVFGSGDGSVVNGSALSKMENKNLTWETTKSNNFGFDLGVFKNRILFVYNYYINTTTDLFLNVPISALTGYGVDLQNYGNVENRGSEFDLTTVNLTGSFKWSTTLNLSNNKNKVLRMGPTDAPIYQGGYGDYAITRVGDPIGSFYMYVADGVYKNQAEIDAGPTPLSGTKPGDVRVKDTNGDDAITAEDRQVVGKPNPDYYWGIRNDFEFKDFDLSIQIMGQNGCQVFNQMGRAIDIGSLGANNQLPNWKNRWRSETDPGDGNTPRANASPTGAGAAGVTTTRWLYDASFWRINNITLGYNLPKQLLDFAHIQKLRVYATIDNLYTQSEYPLYTPEASRFSGNTNIGADYGSYPLSKTFTFGINLTF